MLCAAEAMSGRFGRGAQAGCVLRSYGFTNPLLKIQKSGFLIPVPIWALCPLPGMYMYPQTIALRRCRRDGTTSRAGGENCCTKQRGERRTDEDTDLGNR
jgi:hypothetical protein